jgi:hypothetical protein
MVYSCAAATRRILSMRLIPAALALLAGLILFGAAAPPVFAGENIWPQLQEIIAILEQETESTAVLNKRFAELTVYVPVHGEKARRQVRMAYWYLLLDGDRRAVYDEEGFPYNRVFVNWSGEVTEEWTYPQRHITYVFKGDDLINTRIF